MNLFDAKPNKTRYDLAGQAESYSALAEAYEALAEYETSPQKKATRLRQARDWLQESVAAWQRDPTHGSPDLWADARETMHGGNSAGVKLL